ncbi:MAG TPA: AraC family transcriptional regulator [Jatrophihabitans sp.]|nr:AraC family transcriptional regulator [Jatrophihabitans sp.]
MRTIRTADGRHAAPVYAYDHKPGEPPVSTFRLDRRSLHGIGPGHAHSHDFLVLAYFQRGGGSLRLGDRDWPVRAGDLYVIAPGEIVGIGEQAGALAHAQGWAVSFPPAGLGPNAPDALLSWRTHPLLFPFARGAAHGGQRLTVPTADRRTWSARLAALGHELRTRRDGYRHAVVAHLSLLLVDTARLAADIAGDLRLSDEPLLADVFDFIEKHYHERISLTDVAAALNISSGHLTTVVRRKTGRPVLEWITERRMAQARRLLTETDQSISAIAHHVGYTDPAYFIRTFRNAHDTTPLRWRRAGRQ